MCTRSVICSVRTMNSRTTKEREWSGCREKTLTMVGHWFFVYYVQPFVECLNLQFPISVKIKSNTRIQSNRNISSFSLVQKNLLIWYIWEFKKEHVLHKCIFIWLFTYITLSTLWRCIHFALTLCIFKEFCKLFLLNINTL